MKFAIRADASREIGHGHVMRCLALAAALRSHGAETVFLCRTLPGDACDAIRGAGHRVLPINADTPEADAAASRAALAEPVDWLVVDHYALDARWARAMRPSCRGFMAIDDIADRELDCDLLLDQNWHDQPALRYAGRIPKDAEGLFGPRWALLREEFARARAGMRQRDGRIRRVLVCFGGGDAPNATGAVLDAIAGVPGITLDVVVGAANPHVAALQAQCAALGAAPPTVGANDMAARMVAADLFVGAGGSMSWERACLGLPGITLPIADNQRELCSRIAAAGEGIDLGSADAQAIARLPGLLRDLIGDPSRVRMLGEGFARRCDGRGAARVAARLLGAAAGEASNGSAEDVWMEV
jgi:UDP-2,4-diacetamido-2,4,6-trideoxy-beta-L-altropyranose hydrolase